MIKTKDITLTSGKTITVKEMTVGGFLELLAHFDEKNENLTALTITGMDILFAATGLTAEDLHDLTESDLANIWEAVQEIHAFFLMLARNLSLQEGLKALLTQKLMARFSGTSAD